MTRQRQIKRQIFIGGCSRSGTTLLGAMLGVASQVICTPESHFKIDVLRSPARQGERVDLRQAMALIQRHWRFKIWAYDVDATAVPYDQLRDSYACLLNYLAGGYARFLGKPQAAIWVDHTPENVSYAHTLRQLFPQAKFIHIVRDGRGVAASILPLDWGPNSIEKAARWWLRMVSFGLSAETAYGPENVIRVRYEDLVTQPESTLQQLCAFLEVEYQPEMVLASGFKPPRYTRRQHTFIGRRPDPAVAHRWRDKLSPRDTEIFEYLTRDFLNHLGYELLYGFEAQAPSFWELQKGKVAELFRGEIVNKFKWLRRSYPLWLSRDFYAQARVTDINN